MHQLLPQRKSFKGDQARCRLGNANRFDFSKKMSQNYVFDTRTSTTRADTLNVLQTHGNTVQRVPDWKKKREKLQRFNFCLTSWYHTWSHGHISLCHLLKHTSKFPIVVTGQRFELEFFIHVQWCHLVETPQGLMPCYLGQFFAYQKVVELNPKFISKFTSLRKQTSWDIDPSLTK